MSKFGELKTLPLRELWQNEASDFTPWLASNIEALGKTLGLELELVETEAPVGEFSLDLLAKDLGSSRNVIVENQLTQTDHNHLGKLLTYAAGFSASIVIWVSESIRDEHRQALEWLNQRTDTETQFFGVVTQVLQIDDSKPAYNFKPIVFPNEWQKSKKHKTSSNISSRGEKYRTYFQSLIDELRENYGFTGAKAGQPQSWYSFSTGIKGILYGANFAMGGKARTEIYIDHGDYDQNKNLFDALQKEQAEIESEYGSPFEWERLDDKRSCRIALYCNGTIEASDSELEQLRKWHIENLLKLKTVFIPFIKRIIKQNNITD